MDLVTVIIPIYKVEQYLERCVDSVLSQTYPNLDIILVDDGSPDRCGEICDSYKNDRRVRVIHQENKGLSGARNAGLEIAKGEWVTFIDSDDFIVNNYVESLLSLCYKYSVKVSQCGVVRGKDSVFPEESVETKEKKWDFHILYSSSGREYRTIACAKLYKLYLFDSLRFPEGKINEDEDTVFKVLYNAGEIAITNQHLYYYYMSSESILRSSRKTMRFDVVSIYDDRIDFLADKGEERLINVTEKELCIRLMLSYFNAKKNKYNKDDIDKIREYFIRYYKEVKLDQIVMKERLALIVFRLLPNTFAFFENNFSVIKKNKLKRERN